IRFALNVPGGWWSVLMERSSDFTLFSILLAQIYPEPLDRLILILTSQSIFDDTDPINYAGFQRDAPLPGHPAKRLLMQEGRYDDEVSNIATRAIVRAAGLKRLGPGVVPVWGIDTAKGPLDSAYTQWDVNPPVHPPQSNTPAQKPDPTVSAHKVVRRLVHAVEQLRRFFTPTGKIEETCGGPCICKVGVDCKLKSE
ncbi:MAG: hypothetical protein KAI47_19380, partial [Deltaproteobacteria bacterium]|nr:hypothetical protein [Deltaproteobacteria bacterium]